MQPMVKIVILQLDGDFETSGFRVSLEIWEKGNLANTLGSFFSRRSQKIVGELPPVPNLLSEYDCWQKKYRSLGISTRRNVAKIRENLLQRQRENPVKSIHKGRGEKYLSNRLRFRVIKAKRITHYGAF